MSTSPGSSRKSRLLFRTLWPVLCVAGLWASWPSGVWSNIRLRYANSAVLAQLGYSGYGLFDLFDMAAQWQRQRRLGQLDPAPYRDYLRTLAAARPAPAAPAARRRHVIYIQMEGIDGLVLGARKDGKPLMPFLEDLGASGTRFSSVADNTAGGRTTDAEFLVLTSAVPTRPPAYVSQRLDLIPSLPRVLRASGYRAVGVHGYDGAFWRRGPAHRALGFDEDFFQDRMPGAERIGWGVSDGAVLKFAADLVAQSAQPLFLHVVLLTNHHPFKYYGESIGRPEPGIEASFVQSVGYVDRCLADFYAQLRAAGVLDDCLIAVFADHDSGITAQLEGYLDTVPARRMGDTVPLVITGLGRPAGVVDEITGLQDVPVIMLEALGLPVPATFTGNGFGRFGTTVGALHGALRSTPDGVEPFEFPVSGETLTLLSQRYPEKLLAP